MRTRVSIAILVAAAHAEAQRYTDAFEASVNLGGWSFGIAETIQGTVGSNGMCLNAWGSNVANPRVSSVPGGDSPFTGDFRARRIAALSARLAVMVTDESVADRRPAIILVSDNGTPGNPDDDWGACRLSDAALGPSLQWRWHPFAIDSQGSSLPPGWQFILLGPGAPIPDWDRLIQDIDRVMFSFADPSQAHTPQYWDVAADELSVSSRPVCYVNCDESTGTPCLNVIDFGCFLNRFAAGDSWANCDNSVNPPVLNVLDFGCFLDRWAGSCTAC